MTSGAGLPADGGPVEGYLDLLLVTFSGPPRQVRRMLAEAEAHLREAVDEGLAAGLSAQQAEAAAVRRMGPVHAITGNGAFFLRPTAALARRLAVGGSLVAGVGLVGVGVAGAIAWLLAALYGGQFVTAPFPAGSYTRADCARWLAGDPAAHGCLQAMTADHLGDVVLQAAAGGVLGLIALAVHVMLRRR
jgi:hypothetical protein